MKKTTKKTKITQHPRIEIILTVLLLSVGGVVAYYNVSESIKDSTDRQRFVETEQKMSILRDRIQNRSPKNVLWDKDTICSYSYGTGLQKGGWYCSATIGTDIESTNLSSQNVIDFDTVLGSSTDILVYQSRSSYKDFPQQLNNGGVLITVYKLKNSNMMCRYQASLPDSNSQIYQDGKIVIGFSCSGGARQSWYPNHETDSSIPGKNAWKKKE